MVEVVVITVEVVVAAAVVVVIVVVVVVIVVVADVVVLTAEDADVEEVPVILEVSDLVVLVKTDDGASIIVRVVTKEEFKVEVLDWVEEEVVVAIPVPVTLPAVDELVVDAVAETDEEVAVERVELVAEPLDADDVVEAVELVTVEPLVVDAVELVPPVELVCEALDAVDAAPEVVDAVELVWAVPEVVDAVELVCVVPDATEVVELVDTVLTDVETVELVEAGVDAADEVEVAEVGTVELEVFCTVLVVLELVEAVNAAEEVAVDVDVVELLAEFPPVLEAEEATVELALAEVEGWVEMLVLVLEEVDIKLVVLDPVAGVGVSPAESVLVPRVLSTLDIDSEGEEGGREVIWDIGVKVVIPETDVLEDAVQR